MNSMDKLIESVLNKLDWEFIVEIYNSKNILWEHSKEKTRIPSKKEIYEELRSVLGYIIEEDVPHYFLDIFLIIYTNNPEDEEPDNLLISLLHDTVVIKGLKKEGNLTNKGYIETENDLMIQDMEQEYQKLVKARRYEEAIALTKTINSFKNNL